MKFRMVSVVELKEWMAGSDVLLLDLRDRQDFEKEHIPGAVWADWEQLENQIEDLLHMQKRKIQWIILYCEHGNTSLLAARDLARLGYSVMSVNGGFLRWKRANAPSS